MKKSCSFSDEFIRDVRNLAYRSSFLYSRTDLDKVSCVRFREGRFVSVAFHSRRFSINDWFESDVIIVTSDFSPTSVEIHICYIEGSLKMCTFKSRWRGFCPCRTSLACR